MPESSSSVAAAGSRRIIGYLLSPLIRYKQELQECRVSDRC